MENSRTPWHSLAPKEAISKANSCVSGLTEEEAKERFAQYGANELKAKKKTPLIIVFLRQFLSPLIYVLLAAGVISLVSQFSSETLDTKPTNLENMPYQLVFDSIK